MFLRFLSLKLLFPFRAVLFCKGLQSGRAPFLLRFIIPFASVLLLLLALLLPGGSGSMPAACADRETVVADVLRSLAANLTVSVLMYVSVR